MSVYIFIGIFKDFIPKTLSLFQTFIIRNSSQPNTYALSAQFPTKDGANVDHYLIENINDGYRVQGSSHVFSDITKLVAFYHENL